MSANTTVVLHPEELEMVVGSVFTTMMDIAVEARKEENGLPAPAGLVTAAVYLVGDFKGAVFLHCQVREACEFAARFLGSPTSAQVNDDVRDVLGELANMIAGNLKAALCPGIKLSAPSVVEGSDYCLRVCRGRVIHRSGFQSDQGPFWITVLDAEGA